MSRFVDQHVTQALTGSYHAGCTEECKALPQEAHDMAKAAAALAVPFLRIAAGVTGTEPLAFWQEMMLRKAGWTDDD
jgi:hypothetical protein